MDYRAKAREIVTHAAGPDRDEHWSQWDAALVDLVDAMADDIEKLRRCLVSRDAFLVQRELFKEYASTLTV